jgi:hypothetical protein
MVLKNSFSLTGISGEVQIALHSSRFMPLSRRGWSVSNLPFVKMAGFLVKIACYAIGEQYFTYRFRYKMVSTCPTAEPWGANRKGNYSDPFFLVTPSTLEINQNQTA